eukprot:2238792-Pyramimonas_sp.AAC.1
MCIVMFLFPEGGAARLKDDLDKAVEANKRLEEASARMQTQHDRAVDAAKKMKEQHDKAGLAESGATTAPAVSTQEAARTLMEVKLEEERAYFKAKLEAHAREMVRVGLHAPIKPLLSHPSTGEFNSAPKHLRGVYRGSTGGLQG